MKANGNSFLGTLTAVAAGAVVVFAANATGISAATTPQIDTSHFAPVSLQAPLPPAAPLFESKDIGKMTPVSKLRSYSYAIDIKFLGKEAEDARNGLADTGLDVGPKSQQLAMQYKGLVLGPRQAQVTLSIGSSKAVAWLNGNRYERKVASQAIEKEAGPFDKADLDGVNMFPAEYHWDKGVMAWFDENREDLNCGVTTQSVNASQARECVYAGAGREQAFKLIDLLGSGSFHTYSKFEAKAYFLPLENIPVRVVIDAAGKDKNGEATGISLTMNISDVDSKTLKLPAAPSGS